MCTPAPTQQLCLFQKLEVKTLCQFPKASSLSTASQANNPFFSSRHTPEPLKGLLSSQNSLETCCLLLLFPARWRQGSCLLSGQAYLHSAKSVICHIPCACSSAHQLYIYFMCNVCCRDVITQQLGELEPSDTSLSEQQPGKFPVDSSSSARILQHSWAFSEINSMCDAAMAIHPPKCFPYSIVWTPIPILSWVAPFVGHVGICTSNGVIFDFAGPFFISVDNLAFGHPTRFSQLNPTKVGHTARAPTARQRNAAPAGPSAEVQPPAASSTPSELAAAWDEALQAAVDVYQTHAYQFLGDNCHCFVAHFLNSIAYKGSTRWGTVGIATHVFLHGRCISGAAWARTYLPFVLLLPISAVLGGLIMLFLWLSLMG